MPKRRRYANREELMRLLAERAPEIEDAAIGRVLDALADLGVDLDAFVKIEVVEEV